MARHLFDPVQKVHPEKAWKKFKAVTTVAAISTFNLNTKFGKDH